MTIQRAVKIAVIDGAVQEGDLLYTQINDILFGMDVEGDFSDKSYSYKEDVFLTPKNPILLLIGHDQLKMNTVLIKSLYLQPQVLPIELHRLSEVIEKVIFNISYDPNFTFNNCINGDIEEVRKDIPMVARRCYDALITNLCHEDLSHRNEDLYTSFVGACNEVDECTEKQKLVLWTVKGGFRAAIDSIEREAKFKVDIELLHKKENNIDII